MDIDSRTRFARSLLVVGVALAAACAGRDAGPVPESGATGPVAATAAPDEARAARQQVVLLAAPAPLPTGIPLKGEPGVDRWGYPTQTVDAAALRSLLQHDRYEELTRAFEHFQAEFELDYRHEYWPNDASDAFGSAEPELQDRLDAWVRATPKSFAPYLARGAYWTAVAYARRGGKGVAETPTSDLQAAVDTVKAGTADLARALELRPRLVTARRHQINLAMLTRDDDLIRRAIAGAEADCPGCFRVRVAYLIALTPRWGGGWAAMRSYAQSLPVAAHPRLALLAGYEADDRADVLRREKRLDEALAESQKACALGPHGDFLETRAGIQAARGDLDAALADLNLALTIRPGASAFLFRRARLRGRKDDWEGAATDLLEGLRSLPTDPEARVLRPWVVRGLVRRAWALNDAGQRAESLRIYDLAAQLAPEDREVLARRAQTISAGMPDDETLAVLQASVAAAPDDFRAHQALDYALARRRRLREVVALWDGFLARHPDNGQAFLERGGAKLHLGENEASRADARRACELGVNEGCVRAR